MKVFEILFISSTHVTLIAEDSSRRFHTLEETRLNARPPRFELDGDYEEQKGERLLHSEGDHNLIMRPLRWGFERGAIFSTVESFSTPKARRADVCKTCWRLQRVKAVRPAWRDMR